MSKPWHYVCMLLLCWPLLTTAAQQPPKENLKTVQGKIKTLQKEVSRAEKSHASITTQIKKIETDIAQTNQRLKTLADTRSHIEADLDALEAQLHQIEQHIAQRQNDLSQLLYHRYTHGNQGVFAHLFSGNNPNQIARDNTYLSMIARSQAEMIASLKSSLDEKQQLVTATQAKQEELAQLAKRQDTERSALIKQHAVREKLLAQVSQQIHNHQQTIAKLQQDEKRLSNLITRLAKERAKAKKKHTRTTQPLKNHITPEAHTGNQAFTQLKGRLHLPIQGDIINRYGMPRPEGGTPWRGLFIRADAGHAVKAIANGTVVFADWLRGFGNLLIVDHGDGFLSVYGNNESLLRSEGQTVRMGEALAAVGTRDDGTGSGLYFELRHNGQPIDPLDWVSLK